MFNDHIKIFASDQLFTESQIKGINWEKLFTHVVNEGTASLYYPKFEHVKDVIPENIIRFFRKHYENALLYKDISIQILTELQPALSSTGRVVLTQGLALTETVYREPLCRSMGDIDLFLPDGNIEPARKIFIEYGFRKYRDYENVLQYKQIMVDLHTGLWGTDRFSQREYIIPRRNVTTIPSDLIPGFFILCPEHLALHCAFHGVKHSFYKKIWLLDLLNLYNAGYFSPEADNRQEYVLKYLVFEYLANREVLPSGVCNNTKYHLSQFTKRLLKAVSQLDRPGSGQVSLTLLCPSLGTFLEYLGVIVMPPKQILQQMYGKLSYPELFVMRFWDIVKYVVKLFI